MTFDELIGGYELKALLHYIREYKGTFSMHEDGGWLACIEGYQYRGRGLQQESFRHALSYFMFKNLSNIRTYKEEE